jgi:hypothetical protein
MTDSVNSRAAIQSRIADRQRQRHYYDSESSSPIICSVSPRRNGLAGFALSTALLHPNVVSAHSRMGGGKRCGNNPILRAFLNLQRFWRSGWFSMGCLWCMG